MIFYAHEHANKPEKDGDLHIAGYDKKIGMPVVAEIMNAANEADALDTIQKYQGKGKPDDNVEMTGAWRLWAEHVKNGDHFKQPTGYKKIKNTGPDHIFEIHPVTSVKDLDLLHTLRNIEGFKPYDAKKAFKHYTTRSSKISSKGEFITLQTGKALYNYCDFWIKLLTTEKFEVEDGLFVYCDVLDSKFKLGAHNVPSKTISTFIRIAVPIGSEVYNEIKEMEKGDFLHVLGIPRISLVEVSKKINELTHLLIINEPTFVANPTAVQIDEDQKQFIWINVNQNNGAYQGNIKVWAK